MKKTSLIIIGFIMVFLSGCQSVPNGKDSNKNTTIHNKNNATVRSANLNADKEKNSENSKQTLKGNKPTVENSIASDLPVHIKTSKNFYFDIVEDDKYIYCDSQEGISKIDKKTGKYNIILKQTNIRELTLCGDYLYFIHGKAIYDNEAVFRIDKNGKNYLKIFNDVKQVHHKDVEGISHLKVIGNTLYMDCSLIVFSYNMETKDVRLVVDDADEYEVVGDNIYYIEHAQRTFTIYKKNLKSMKSKIIIGQGKVEPKTGTLYKNFIFVGDKMYYSTSRPYGVYCYKNGKRTTISDKNMSWVHAILKYKDNLYYIEDINEKDSKLMKVNTNNNTSSQVTMLKDYSWGWEKIINGYLYYYTREDEMKSFRLR